MPAAEWLVAHLGEIGAGNADGVSRAVRSRRCPGCGRTVLRGLDADRCAMAVTCDAQEIDTFGELVALLGGAATYTLTRSTNSSGRTTWNLTHRHARAVRAGQDTAIVPEHRCGIEIVPTERSHLPVWLRPVPLPDAPPF